MNIAVLGGNFDPPHIWHYWTARQVIENIKGIDQVWYMPDYQNAFKPAIASSIDRVEMLKDMQTGRIRLSTIATVKQTTTYTIDIVRELLKDKKNRYYWIVGSDITSQITKWRDYKKLSQLIQFIVFPRKDYPIKKLPSGFHRVGGNLLLSNISSSLVRRRVSAGHPITALVFPKVEEYIKKRNLYRYT